MRRWPALVLLLLWGAPLPGLTPQQAFVLAARDAARLPAGQSPDARYLWAGMYGPSKEGEAKRERLFLALVLAANSASRSAEPAVPFKVHPDLWRIYLSDLKWDPAVYERLANLDPYFHAKAAPKPAARPKAGAARRAAGAVDKPAPLVGKEVTILEGCWATLQSDPWRPRAVRAGVQMLVLQEQGERLLIKTGKGPAWVDRSSVSAPAEEEAEEAPEEPKEAEGPAKEEPREPVKEPAPRTPRWLPAKALADLIVLTQSQAPLLRADWLLAQVSRQVDLEEKQEAGYYDFLGVKDEADVEKLAGLDRRVAAGRRSEVRAIIPVSGVALHNRQVASPQAGYWESLDVADSIGEHNAVRQLDEDYKPQAKEVYFRLPNGLWGLAAVNVGNGKLAATVPDNIAADKKTTSNDHRIHPGLSCIRCHVEGLRPLDDWARAFYGPPGDTRLTAVDPDKQRRLRGLYLGPLQDRYDDDQRFYARALARLTGKAPAEAAKGLASAWSEYVDEPITGEQLARELGTGPKAMRAAFAEYAQANPGAGDPVLLGYLKKPEYAARREYVREAYVLMQLALLEYRPGDAADTAGYGGGP